MDILVRALQIFLNILNWLIIVRVLLSWFRPRYRTSSNSWFFTIDEMVWRATEPLLAPIRRLLPTSGMGIDFAPLIVLLLIQVISNSLR
ncbi:MAG TPA: YggT family protein [Symbiobacteriaceae bacterium]|jgi:YggT family protein|nr:YggT family protein [Symbiobacteriaceae bacterium]